MRYNKFFFLLIFIISLIPLLDLFHSGLPITHDGQDHVTRIANFYQALIEGNIVPRWAGNLNWGYGHPILMFLYPLPSYIASFFHFIGFSLVDSLKIIFGLGFIASGFTMYIWIKEFLGEEAGIISAALYLFAPYRFVDLYVRGAVGEHVAFIFPPLVCYFLLKIAKKYKFWYVIGGAFSVAGLILSHNAITIMFLPIIMFYAAFLLYQNDNKKLIAIRYTLIAILGFGLASFFLLPAFFEGKYTLRDIVTKGEYSKRFVLWKDFIFGPWSYGGSGLFTVQVGIMQWIMALGTLAIFFKKKAPYKHITIALVILFLFVLGIMTNSSKIIWETITTLQKFQFPWRFLSVVVFLAACMGGIVVAALIPKKIKTFFVGIILLLVLFLNKDYWHANGYLNKPQAFFTGIYSGTTDTGESAPIWSVRFMEQQAKEPIQIVDGEGNLNVVSRTTTKHVYIIEMLSDTGRIVENTLYFPGWNVIVDGEKSSIEFQDPQYRGLMTFYLTKGIHNVEVVFTETKLRSFANAISIVSLVILLLWGILQKKPIWRLFRLS